MWCYSTVSAVVGAIRAACRAGITAANAPAVSKEEQGRRRYSTCPTARRSCSSAVMSRPVRAAPTPPMTRPINVIPTTSRSTRATICLGWGAEGETDPDFSSPLKHGVAEEPIDSNDHQDARHQGEERRQHCQCAVSHQNGRPSAGTRTGRRQGETRGVRGELLRKNRQQRPHLQLRPHLNHGGVLRPVRFVDRGWRRLTKVRILCVPCHADHFLGNQGGAAVDAEELPADRRLAWSVLLGKVLVDDDREPAIPVAHPATPGLVRP